MIHELELDYKPCYITMDYYKGDKDAELETGITYEQHLKNLELWNEACRNERNGIFNNQPFIKTTPVMITKDNEIIKELKSQNVQTRSDTPHSKYSGLCYFKTIKDAMNAAKEDFGIYKISFDYVRIDENDELVKERIMLRRNKENKFVFYEYESIM